MPSDDLERALAAADPAREATVERTPEELRARARALMQAEQRGRSRSRSARHRLPTPRSAGRPALALCVMVALVLALAELPNREAKGLPAAVRTFARQLRASGVLHFESAPARISAAGGEPAIGDLGPAYEVWLDLDGSGWRSRQLDDGRVRSETVADAAGVRTRRPGGRWTRRLPARLPGDYLRKPFVDGVVVDALRQVRDGRLDVVGHATVRGHATFVLAASSARGSGGRPAASANVRCFVDRDDGSLLRITTGIRLSTGDPDALGQSDRALLDRTRPRTRVQDVLRYEVLARTASTLRLTRTGP